MSSKAQHYRAGAVLGIVLAGGLYPFYGITYSAVALIGSIAGSSAPDWLEISWHTGGGKKQGWFATGYEEGVRHSIIPHRTITHWLLVWTILLIVTVVYFFRSSDLVSCFAVGFVLSAWLHIKMDSNTPMGVPWFHPWKRVIPTKH